MARTRVRVALVYPVLSRTGGVERYLHHLAEELSRSHEVTLVIGTQEAAAPAGCRVRRVPYLARPRFLAPITFSLAASLRLRAPDVDVVNVHGASGFRADVVTAHSCHKAWFRQSRDALPRWSRRWWLKVLNPAHYLTILIETLQYRPGRHRRVISVSTSVKRELMEHYGLADEDVVVIPSGVDAREFDPVRRGTARGPVRARYGIGEAELLLLFVGNEFRRKGLGTVLEALSAPELAGARLLVAGKDDPAPYRADAERLGVAARLVFAGPTNDAAELYAAADVFVMPTRYEAFSLVLLEAMASGLPVVTTRTAGAVELVRDGVDGCLVDDPDDARALAARLGGLREGAARARMGAQARARAEAFTWLRVADRTAEVLAGRPPLAVP